MDEISHTGANISHFVRYLWLYKIPHTQANISHLGRAQTKTNFAAMKLFETKKENELQQTKRGLG